MKVAILFDNLGPYHLARVSAASEVVDVLAVEFGGSSQEYGWERSEKEDSLRRTTLFPGNSSHEASSKAFKNRLWQVLDGFEPAAVLIPGWSGRGAFLALQWCLTNNIPAIVMSESSAHDDARSGWREWIKKRYVQLCSAALVGGRPHQEYMQQLGMEPECIFRGYDAVDNDYFANKVAELRNADWGVRNKYKLPENYFLASARFIPKKNLSRLIEAYAQYRTQSAIRNPQSAIWKLVLLGDGELREKLEFQVSSLNLQEFVHLPGFIQYPDLPTYYGLAGAFIHASTTEQWGLVVNEAMASGLPVLVSNRCGCAPDLVEEGVNGYTFDPTNIEQLAQLMLQVCSGGVVNEQSDVVGLHSAFDFPLSAFGAESARIISKWGPRRFAEGMVAAAEMAMQRPLPTANWIDRLMLGALAYR